MSMTVKAAMAAVPGPDGDAHPDAAGGVNLIPIDGASMLGRGRVQAGEHNVTPRQGS